MNLHRVNLWASFYFWAALVTLLLCMTLTLAAQEIKDCVAEPPNAPQEQWAWRTIDGRRCWYQGRRMYPKHLLRWSVPGTEMPKDEPEGIDSIKELAPSMRGEIESRVYARDEEFEGRWNAIHDHRWARDPVPIERWRMW